MLRYLRMLRPYGWWVALALLMGILTVLANMGLLSTSAYLIAKAAQHPSTILLLWVPIVGVRFFGISRGIFRYLERYLSHNVTFQLLKELRVYTYRRLEPLIPATLSSYHSGDLLSRVTGDIDVLQNLYLGLFSPPIIAAVTFMVAIGFLDSFSQHMALVLGMFLIASGFFVPWLTQQLAGTHSRALVNTRADLSTQLVELIDGNADILALGQERSRLEQLDDTLRKWVRERLFLHGVSGLGAALTVGLNNGAMWAILVVGIGLVTTHHLAPIFLPVVVLLSWASFEGVNALPQAVQFRGQIREAATRINELIDQSPDYPVGRWSLEHITSGGNPPSIEFYDVHFRYRSGRDEGLAGVSFQVGASQHVAVVGPSGAGKSTLAGIVSGLWPYQQGEVLMNGRPLSGVDPRVLPRLVGVVEQIPHLFNTTVRQNLLLANPQAQDRSLLSALEIVELADVVASLPQGLDTVIGEHGAKLSGGERKRLAIARVILQNPSVVVMDEATEGLDLLTERKVIQAIRQWSRHKTILWVTHRLSNLDAFDGVIVLANGKVVESGTAQELVRRQGLFTRMLIAEERSIEWNVTEGYHPENNKCRPALLNTKPLRQDSV